MIKIEQDKNELLSNLSILETDWKDDFSNEVISFLDNIDINSIKNNRNAIKDLFEKNFDAASTVF